MADGQAPVPDQRATLWPVWVSGLAAALLFAFIASYLSPLSPDPIQLQLSFTPRAFGEVVHAWPPEHLARYRAHFPADFALLLCYGAFGRWLVMRTALTAPLPIEWQVAARWMLPLAAACDATENIAHLWLTEVPRFGMAWLYASSAIVAALKWVLIGCFVLTALAGLATHGWARWGRRGHSA